MTRVVALVQPPPSSHDWRRVAAAANIGKALAAQASLDETGATRYHCNMIESFADWEAERIFRGETSRRLPADSQRTARRELLYLDDAGDLRDLRAPPGNRREKLRGANGDARIVDYHAWDQVGVKRLPPVERRQSQSSCASSPPA